MSGGQKERVAIAGHGWRSGCAVVGREHTTMVIVTQDSRATSRGSAPRHLKKRCVERGVAGP